MVIFWLGSHDAGARGAYVDNSHTNKRNTNKSVYILIIMDYAIDRR